MAATEEHLKGGSWNNSMARKEKIYIKPLLP